MIASGHTLDTTPPQEVTNAIAKIDRETATAKHSLYSDHKSAIEAEWKARVAHAEQTLTAATDAMDRLREFEQAHGRFAAACGEPTRPRVATDDAITAFAFRAWQSRAQQILNPPAPQPSQQRRQPIPLALD
jgi:hypothetical protein